jgi:predicted HTH domain antitoxin
MNLVIPDDILAASDLTEEDLKLELAIVLYKRAKISAGKACEWLGMNLIEFRRILSDRDIPINYALSDLQDDIETLRSLGRL